METNIDKANRVIHSPVCAGFGGIARDAQDINDAGSFLADRADPQIRMMCYMDPCVACEIKKD